MALRRARKIGLVLLGVQLLVFGWWSALLASRSALSYDFATHQQAMFLISHGVLSPYSTVQRFWYYQDHGELLFWLFAPLQWISHSPDGLLWLQDAATVGAELLAFRWISEIAASRAQTDNGVRMPVALLVLGLVLLLTNPWTIWSASQDVHTEAFAVLFALAATRALVLERRGLWIYAALCLSTGDVGTTYMCAVAVSGMLCGRYAWRRGVALLGVSLLWFVVLQVTHANHGDIIVQYANLAGVHVAPRANFATAGAALQAKVTGATIVKGVIGHPWRPFVALWAHAWNIWAVISAAGVIGWLWPPVLVPCVLVMLEADLGSGLQFSAPSFQQVLVGIFAAVGTVAILSKLSERAPSRRRSASLAAVMVLLVLIAAGWAIVWMPQLPNRWLRTDSASAAVLGHVAAQARAADEIVADNGVVGGFADHRYVYTLMEDRESFPVRAKHVWFLIAPYEGIETIPVGAQLADIAQLLRTPGARLVTVQHGVFAFEWTPPPGVKRYAFQGGNGSLPAWLAAGDAGTVVRSGGPSHWYAASTAKTGYVVARGYRQSAAGRYQGNVSLSVHGTVNVELWYVGRGYKLLARDVVTNTHGRKLISLSGTAPGGLARPPVYNGWGIWSDRNIDSLYPQVELRVWSPGTTTKAKVYWFSVKRVGR